MKIDATRSETNLTDLARRLFKIEGPQADSEERKAVAALRRANPHLQPGATLPEGAPIVVPEVEGLEPSRTPATVFDLSKEGSEQLRTALARAGDALEAAQAEALQEEEAEAAQLRQHARELKAAGPEAAERLAAIQKAAKRRAKELAERRKLQQEAVALLGKDLEVLLRITH